MSELAFPSHLWTVAETARFLGIPVATLYQFNHKRTGPVFFRIGKYCRYDPQDVLAWLERRRSIGGDCGG